MSSFTRFHRILSMHNTPKRQLIPFPHPSLLSLIQSKPEHGVHVANGNPAAGGTTTTAALKEQSTCPP